MNVERGTLNVEGGRWNVEGGTWKHKVGLAGMQEFGSGNE
jgi:hypothetical protein